MVVPRLDSPSRSGRGRRKLKLFCHHRRRSAVSSVGFVVFVSCMGLWLIQQQPSFPSLILYEAIHDLPVATAPTPTISSAASPRKKEVYGLPRTSSTKKVYGSKKRIVDSDARTKSNTDLAIAPFHPNPRVYPGPPRKFSPLPFDGDGVPNVVHGCVSGANTNATTNTELMIDQIQIHVHVASSSFLLWESLQKANYSGWTKALPLYIIISEEATAAATIPDSFQWGHGPMHVIRSNVTYTWWDYLAQAARQAGSNSLFIALSENTQLSPIYFQYLQHVLRKYAKTPRCRDSNLVGFALAHLSGGGKALRKALDQQRKQRRSRHGNGNTVILSNRGSTSPAAIWSDQITQFYPFAKRRVKHPRAVPDIPNFPSTTTVDWKRAWMEFIYGRGLVMLYPVLVNSGQLACRATQPQSCFEELIDKDDGVDINLPTYGDLSILNIQNQLTSKEILMATGTHHLNTIYNVSQGSQGLLRYWARPGWKVPSIWKNGEGDASNNPLLCVADAYSSAELMNNRTAADSTKASTTRYFLFEPQFGTNNQIHAIMEGYYWAKLLGRQLVLPPLLTPRVSAFSDAVQNRSHWIDFERFYQLLPFGDSQNFFGKHFRQPYFGGRHEHDDLPPISFAKFEQLNIQPWRFLRLTRTTAFDQFARLLTESMGLPVDGELVQLKHLFNQVVPVERVQHLLGGCNDQVLAVDSIYFAALIDADPRKLMAETLALSPAIQDDISKVQESLRAELGSSNYTCYHVRLGDFAQMCASIEDRNSDPDHVGQWLKKTAKRFQCSVGNDDLKAELLDDPRPALILSDDPDALREAIAAKTATGTPVVTSHWINNVTRSASGFVGDELNLLSLVVDQTLCANAEVAILNRFSTVSQRIASVRQEQGVKYWEKKERRYTIGDD